jgi:hypothetical protein
VRCSRCRTDQGRDQFGPSADAYPLHRECKTCMNNRAMRRKHGINKVEKSLIAAAQGGCRICGHPEPSTCGWVVDHDRDCCSGDKSCPKCRRGVICQWCNNVLGSAFDRPQILRAAADYLERARDCSWHMPVACAPSICGDGAKRDATYLNGQDVLTQMGSPQVDPATNASRAGGSEIDLVSRDHQQRRTG